MKFGVIGLGRFGYQVAVTLAENGMEVLAIDSNESTIASIRDKVTQAICMRVVDENSLRAIGIEEVDTAIVSMAENISQSILVTALLKKRVNVPQVIARGTSDIHNEILTLLGADQVIMPERDMGVKVANQLSSPFIDVVAITENFALTQLQAPEKFVGQSVQDLNLYEKYKVRCVGVKKDGDAVVIDMNYVVAPQDKLILAGTRTDLDKVAAV